MFSKLRYLLPHLRPIKNKAANYVWQYALSSVRWYAKAYLGDAFEKYVSNDKPPASTEVLCPLTLSYLFSHPKDVLATDPMTFLSSAAAMGLSTVETLLELYIEQYTAHLIFSEITDETSHSQFNQILGVVGPFGIAITIHAIRQHAFGNTLSELFRLNQLPGLEIPGGAKAIPTDTLKEMQALLNKTQPENIKAEVLTHHFNINDAKALHKANFHHMANTIETMIDDKEKSHTLFNLYQKKGDAGAHTEVVPKPKALLSEHYLLDRP